MTAKHGIGLIVAMASLSACYGRSPGAPIRPGYNSFSKEQDIQLGQEAAQKIKQQSQIVQNQFLQDYVNRIGQKLAGTSEARNSGFKFTFTVINDPTVNAFALPGGPMFIQTGLLKDVDNEGQLAGVMGHEMSHVILRHGTNQASKAKLVQIPAMLASLVAGHSILGQLAVMGITNSTLLHFSRTDESEADLLGAHLMAEAGYDPIQMARFFDKLAKSGGSRGPQFLSDHPNPGNREQAIEAEVRSLPKRSYNADTGDFQKMKQELARVPNAPAGANGLRGAASAPDGQPSGGMKELHGQSFSLSYPANWQAFGGNNSDSVTIAPKNGIVQGANGTAQVGYGVIVSFFSPDTNHGTDIVANTEDLIHHLRSENPGMQVAGGSRRVRVDNHDGLVTTLQSDSPFGSAETDTLLTVSTPRGVFYLVFIAPKSQFDKLQGTFEQMIQSIHLTA